MTYYDDLLRDNDRLDAFRESITGHANGIVYDLGTGSGILSTYASDNASSVYALEINRSAFRLARSSFKNYDNITLICDDATTHEFEYEPDVVICEMLDTALIDEQQVPVINNALKYSKNSTIFIPESVCTTIELVYLENIPHITYYEDNIPEHTTISDATCFDVVKLNSPIDPVVDKSVNIKANIDSIVNAIKLTTYTLLPGDIMAKPSSMLNPPLIIPTNKVGIKRNETIDVNLSYIMGGGLDSIKTSIRRTS